MQEPALVRMVHVTFVGLYLPPPPPPPPKKKKKKKQTLPRFKPLLPKSTIFIVSVTIQELIRGNGTVIQETDYNVPEKLTFSCSKTRSQSHSFFELDYNEHTHPEVGIFHMICFCRLSYGPK